ncbi:MAG: RAD55 family ATPase [Nitrososphaerales archaeon]
MSSKNPEDRRPTGIPGLDPLIQGGLQRGDFVLLLGGLGTGKTIFSCQFVYNAALALKEPAVFATFEEDVKSLKRNMLNFGMDLSALEAQKRLKLIDLDVLEGRGLSSNIQVLLEALDEVKGRRLVVDSLTAFLAGTGEKFDYTFMMHLIYKTLKREGITTLMTASRQIYRTQETGVEEFVADGIFQLESYVSEAMEMKTRFLVKKLRGTEHDRKYHSLAFTPSGLSILTFSG